MRFLVLVLVVAFALGVSGCSEEQKPASTRKVTPAAPKRVAAVPQVAVADDVPVENYRYQAEGKRDPFASLLKLREPLNEDAEPETPLQTFGLKELQLIAVVIGQNEPRAMVVAPDKKAYTLVAGIKVGRNRGQVVDITENKVVVEERYRDFSGALRTELKEIVLPQGEGE